jgi:hypothetical protein
VSVLALSSWAAQSDDSGGEFLVAPIPPRLGPNPPRLPPREELNRGVPVDVPRGGRGRDVGADEAAVSVDM